MYQGIRPMRRWTVVLALTAAVASHELEFVVFVTKA